MDGRLKIGQLATSAGVTAKAIRFYERKRILPPPRRAANRYRVYDEGAVDFTTVLLAQQFLVEQQNLYVASRGQTALSLVTLYKSLGGGWEPPRGAPGRP